MLPKAFLSHQLPIYTVSYKETINAGQVFLLKKQHDNSDQNLY